VPEITQQLKVALADRYVVERELGEGGMAMVYLARDLKHDRKVALKVLRPELAAVIGAERFLAEIKVTANLQHPHILPLHDSGEADTFLYYVMPYVEGETLRDKIKREKQLGIEEAIEITRSVAAALDYAHRQDVIHRDIKPENILMHDGQAMVADFGIALALSHAGGTRLTETGLSIGTPHYMSPEQAMGDRELDARSDVYSLGAMLYEMLAGDPPYTGSTAQAIVAKVITEKAPPVTTHRDTVPSHVAAAIAKSLSKLPADRFRSAAEFAEALTNTAFTMASTEVGAAGRGRAGSLWNPLSIGASALAALLLIVAGWALMRPAPPVLVTRFAVLLDDDQALYYSGSGNPHRAAISPDGTELVYVGVDSGVPVVDDRFSSTVGSVSWKLWHRPFEQLRATPLPGTERGWAPVISPDGEQVAFLVPDGDWQIKVISLAGGPPITALDSGLFGSVSWGPKDELYFVGGEGRTVRRVPASGGPAEDVVTLDSAGSGMVFENLHVLPGGRGAVVTAVPIGANQPSELEVRVVDLESGETRASVTGVQGAYAASGHLVYVTAQGTLMAAPFDLGSLTLKGRPTALFEGVEVRLGGTTDLSLSAAGTLVYTTEGLNVPEHVVWVTPSGTTELVDPDWVRDVEFEGIALSPDGSRLAIQIVTDTRSDIWIKQLDRGPLSRLTFGGAENGIPTWSPDGRYVAFGSLREGGWSTWIKRADGSGGEELLVDLDRNIWETQWSSDGEWLVISVNGPPGTDDILGLRIGVDSVPVPLVADGFDEFEPALSPDGSWLAYVSNESGRSEVYVRPFPNTGDGKWQISTAGGTEPVWSTDGETLYYRSPDFQSIMAADMSRGATTVTRRVFLALPSENNYESNPRNRLYDVAPDGRFVMLERAGTGDISGDLVIVQNFFEELKERVER
jgi:serine/threonine-protein kinase